MIETLRTLQATLTSITASINLEIDALGTGGIKYGPIRNARKLLQELKVCAQEYRTELTNVLKRSKTETPTE